MGSAGGNNLRDLEGAPRAGGGAVQRALVAESLGLKGTHPEGHLLGPLDAQVAHYTVIRGD